MLPNNKINKYIFEFKNEKGSLYSVITSMQ